MTPSHVIWDWNGTLLDDVWLCVDIVNGMLRARGKREIGVEFYREIFRFPVVNVYTSVGLDVSNGGFERMSVEYMDAYQARRGQCSLHADALDVLASLRKAGVGQSILSAYRQDMLESIIQGMGIGGYFEQLAGNSDIYAASKVDYGRKLVARLGADPASMTLVGDTEHDHEVACELGVGCVLVSHGHNDARRLEKTGAKVLPSLGAVARHLGVRGA
jgi:phosphoglycolate phosphatase